MTVTYLIGNGFDIALGLDTSYRSFYDKVLVPLTSDTSNTIIKEICSDKDAWADMELSLGQLTSDQIDPESFFDNKIEIEELLERYLFNEQEAFSCDYSDELQNVVKKAFCSFHNELKDTERIAIDNIIKRHNGEHHLFQVISFNYTNTLDEIFKVIKEVNGETIDAYSHSNRTYQKRLGQIHHVNGILGEGIILGVNDESQIADAQLNSDESILATTIKSRANLQKGSRSTEIAEELINRSDIICVFGMSYGVTDRYWWTQLCGWLTQHNDRRLILFNYNPNVKLSNNVGLNYKQEQAIFNKFKEVAGVSEETWNSIRAKIYVKEKPQLFDFKCLLDGNNQEANTVLKPLTPEEIDEIFE